MVVNENRTINEESYAVGDILWETYGYDETRADFYQIVKTSNRSVWLKPIRYEITSHDDDEFIEPVKDDFIERRFKDNKAIMKRIRDFMTVSGFGSLVKWEDGKPQKWSTFVR